MGASAECCSLVPCCRGCWSGLSPAFPYFMRGSAMNIEQLRLAVAEKEAVVKWLEAELEKEDRELVELEKQLDMAEERAQWT